MAPRARHQAVAAAKTALNGRRAGVLAVVFALALGGCTIPEAQVGFDGVLEVFGPSAPFADGAVPDDWATDGFSAPRLAREFLAVETVRETPVLTITPAEEAYILARRVNAFVLSSPFLRWSWNMTAPNDGDHPLRLVVGFFGGAPGSASRGGRPFVYLGTPLPAYDRVMALSWGVSALERGFVDTARPTPRYIVRGGPENAGRWWTETVDLGQLYRRAWPKDDPVRARIVFIGFAARAADRSSSGKFADIVLSR